MKRDAIEKSWRVVAAVCVQRLPSLSREKTALELEYEEMKNQIRIERSKLSDFELEEQKHEKLVQARIKMASEELSEGTVRFLPKD